MILRLAFTIAATTALVAGGPAAPQAGRLQPQAGGGVARQESTLEHQGRVRRYLLHVPAGSQGPLPVILSFHGGGGNAENHRDNVRWEELADIEGFAVVYPYGTGRFDRHLLTWNAGGCCGYAATYAVDDVGFVRALLDDLAARTAIDRSRVYATGFSNGGMFVYRLAAEAADVIAAIAPVGGAMEMDSIGAARPVPVMHIHSVDDPRALYDGGLGPPFPLTGQRVDHAPVEAALARWIAHDRCPAEPRVAAEERGEAGTPAEGHTATKLAYGPCAAGAEVVLWRLSGAGHVWPGGARRRARWLVGEQTDLIDARREIWSFLSRYSLPDALNR